MSAFSHKVVRYRCALYAVPHSPMAFLLGRIVSPRSERAYSTRGGTSGQTVRVQGVTFLCLSSNERRRTPCCFLQK